MLGTIINSVTIIVASLIGITLKKVIDEKYEKPLMQVIGLSVIIISILGVITSAITIENGILKSQGEILLLISLVLGVLIGEFLKIDDRINNFGKLIEDKFKLGNFSKGFIMSTIIFCAGAMAIFGPIQNAIENKIDILLIKSMLDGILALILSSTMGIGVIFSAVSVFLYQGFFALLAHTISPILTPEVMVSINMIGYSIMATIGINQMGIAKVKTANLVPALIVPVIYHSFF